VTAFEQSFALSLIDFSLKVGSKTPFHLSVDFSDYPELTCFELVTFLHFLGQ